MSDTSKPPVGGITVRETPESTIARLWGEIDEALRHEAGAALSRTLDRGFPVVIDTREVTFIDSTGIAFLIQFCTIGREEGLAVTLVDPPAVVTEVLDLLGLTHMFDAEPADRTASSRDTQIDA
ncbi:STAS domain-containing protein [Actinotalea sp. BY-33]|uniref:STAS domain-containing protein n=1 Tax=Actinotalea soli TaxID=2819234 RepID=A0A939RSA5_9CELL|nr:STAS domain-containing protein [Actinotalea soli]MBO1750652.1 STAS domain-containing protein [Actinotalea soli]